MTQRTAGRSPVPRGTVPRGTVTRWVLLAGALALAAVALLGLQATFALERVLVWTRGSGWAALVTLLLALCATPAGRLLARRHPAAARRAPAIRRALGITAAALASVHAAVAVRTYLAGALGPVLEHAWLRSGALALAVLLALWLTSYPRVVRTLRVKLWKPLHRLAYVAALLALLHAGLSPLAPRAWVLGAVGVALAAGLARLIPRAQREGSSQRAS